MRGREQAAVETQASTTEKKKLIKNAQAVVVRERLAVETQAAAAAQAAALAGGAPVAGRSAPPLPHCASPLSLPLCVFFSCASPLSPFLCSVLPSCASPLSLPVLSASLSSPAALSFSSRPPLQLGHLGAPGAAGGRRSRGRAARGGCAPLQPGSVRAAAAGRGVREEKKWLTPPMVAVPRFSLAAYVRQRAAGRGVRKMAAHEARALTLISIDLH